MSIKGSGLYLTEVDKIAETVYCQHDLMGENLIETHSHKKGQFLYTEGGIVHIELADRTFFLPARHYMWIPSQVAHSIRADSADVIMRNLYFPISEGDPHFFREIGVYPVTDLLLQMILFTKDWTGNITPRDQAHFAFVVALKSILPELGGERITLALPSTRDVRLSKVVAYLHQNTDENIGFSQLASQFNFTERTLSRLFQKDAGLSFIQYFTLLRVIKSLSLLLEGNLSVNEIALAVGYSSTPTFSNTFTKMVGIRPSDYLKLRRVLM